MWSESAWNSPAGGQRIRTQHNDSPIRSHQPSGVSNPWRFLLSSQKLDHNPGAHCLTAADLLDRYLNFLKTAQGLADATVVLRRLHVGPFLQSLEKQGTLSGLCSLAPNVVHDYIIEISQPLTRASRKHLVSALRSFLRFAHVKGY